MAITARPTGAHDLKLICEHRERMFAESGRTRESLRPMTAAFEQWLVPRLEEGSYFGWMLEEAGVVIAGLGMMVIDWPPHPSHPADHRRAYILNVFRAKASAKGSGQAFDGAGRSARPRTRRGLRHPSFDAAGTRALRMPGVGADERDGDPLGVGDQSDRLVRAAFTRLEHSGRLVNLLGK